MRLRIHHPLLAGFLGVIGLLVALIVLLLGTGLRQDLLGTFRAELERQLALAAAIMDDADPARPDDVARLITERIGYRVTVIDREGVVLGDSYMEPGRLAEVENHAGRPEVRAVLSGSERVAFAERPSATVGASLLYGARMASLGGTPVVLRIAAPQTEIERTVDRIQRTVAVTGLVAMALSLLVAYAFSRILARPLVALADRARRLADGDLTSRVPGARVAELQDVAVAFNRLTDELRSHLSELGRERDEMETLIDCMAEGVVALTDDGRVLRTNRAVRALLELPAVPQFSPIGAVIRHAELRDALEDSVTVEEQSREIEIGGRNILLASRALDRGGAVTTLLDITELRHLEQVRRDFVANASHELKTPLTSIRGYAETLVESDPPEDLRRKFLASIRNNTLRLQRLVDDLLDISRLESGGWSAASERVAVAAVAREARDLVVANAERPPAAFTVEGDAEVLGDRQALLHIFRNLIENAFRHTPSSGHVRVDVSTDGRGKVEVAVSDDGEGIPARALPRIFERFYRADSSRARDAGGTGLGLAIVKHLVAAMGGDAQAESVLGRGTTIRLTLPIA